MTRTNTTRSAIAAVGAAAAIALTAGPAAASSIVSLDVGQPTAEIATTLKVRTIAETTGTSLYVKTRATGGPPCAPTRGTDPGNYLGAASGVPVGDTTKDQVVTFTDPGTFQWCAWIMDGSTTVAASTGTFTVSNPAGAITGVVAPVSVPRDRDFLVTVSGASEVSRRLLWRVRAAGEPPCAAQPKLDPGTTSIADAGSVLGSFSKQITLRLSAFGTYRLCTWVASDRSDIAALGVNETTIRVPAPLNTSIRVSAAPAGSQRSRSFRVNAFVSSRAGAPEGRCEFDRRVRGRWQPYASVDFSAGRACRVRIVAGEPGRTLFRVRYISTNGFRPSVGFSARVFVSRSGRG